MHNAMNYKKFCLGLACISILGMCLYAQDNELDLQTKWTGQPPSHETPSSAAKWMQTPLDQQVLICVSNFYANASDYLEINVGGQRRLFYGAGTDGLGNYIPTNYPPVALGAVLRRVYTMNMMCPNSGPNGSPFFQVGELDPNNFLPLLTNSITDPVSAYLWATFSTNIQRGLTNTGATYDAQETNLVLGINQILSGTNLYALGICGGVTLASDTTNLLYQIPPPKGQLARQ